MKTALIMHLLKPHPEPTQPSSYRPLSFINSDIKIIDKALTNRIENVISSIIHADQADFMKGRCWFQCTQKILILMQLSKRRKLKIMLESNGNSYSQLYKGVDLESHS